jgi:hypothetical protein
VEAAGNRHQGVVAVDSLPSRVVLSREIKGSARIRPNKSSVRWNGASVKHVPSSRSVSGAVAVEA